MLETYLWQAQIPRGLLYIRTRNFLNMTSDKTLKHLFLAGHVEGVSYLLLLFVAMPLKYFADMPKAVSVAGMIHGVLFVWLIFAIFLAFSQDKINLKKAILVFLASLIPFATFFLERIVLGRKAL